MDDLLPLSEYVAADRASRWRSTLVMSLLWGIPVTSLTLWTGRYELDFWTTLAVGAVGSLAFGGLWTLMFRTAEEWMLRRIHRCDSRIVPAPPGEDFELRFACTRLQPHGLSAGGHFYVGPTRWVFVPHLRNPRRLRTPLTLALDGRLGIGIERYRLSGPARLIAPDPFPVLRLETPGHVLLLRVPQAARIEVALRRYLGSCKPGGIEG